MSPFEVIGRARRVGKMAALIPLGMDRESVAVAADFVARLAPADRDRVAAAAGVRPSAEIT
jgi:hypothetical protein